MPTPRLSDETAQQAADAFRRHATYEAGAAALGIPRGTFEARVTAAIRRGFCTRADRGALVTPVAVANATGDTEAMLKDQVRTLRAQIAASQRESLTDEYVRREIFRLAEAPVDVPTWLTSKSKSSGVTGVPTLFASDWHWGEVVFPSQVGGVNEYNLGVAHRRARTLIEKTVDLLRNHMVSPNYPGIVFALGGDLMSGDIHEELSETNEAPVMPALVDLFGVLTWCISTLADEFGNVFVPCVTGNHGRNTRKPRAKNRNFSNFDWLLYTFLAKRFETDKRVRFLIPDGADAYYSIFNHRYLLTHGDQFRGGGGIAGPLMTIVRGDHKKRSRNAQISMEYDTMLMGHWHQLIQLDRVIVNGSLKGLDEYAYTGNFGFEAPEQALWLTHPEHGITFSLPVKLEPSRKKPVRQWVGWPE